MEGRLVLKDCSIFHPDGRIRYGMAVVIDGAAITRVAPDAEVPVLPGDWEVACGGRLVTPHLVADARLPAPRPLGYSPVILAPVREGLWRVVNDGGTAGAARVPGLEVAGKTGTVQVVSHQAWQDTSTLPWEQRNHAWFASYAPAGAPELVVVVFVEHGGQGSRAAAPIAGALHAFYFRTDLGTAAAS